MDVPSVARFRVTEVLLLACKGDITLSLVARVGPGADGDEAAAKDREAWPSDTEADAGEILAEKEDCRKVVGEDVVEAKLRPPIGPPLGKAMFEADCSACGG